MTALPGKPASNSKPDNGVSDLLSSSPGARLQKAREAKGLEVAEAADSLNLSPGVVKALEADDYRALPNATFVKGYLRSYARILEIPGEELVRCYESISGSDQPKAQAPIEPPRGGTKSTTYLIGAAILLLLLLVWLFWPSGESDSDNPAEAQDAMEVQPVSVDPVPEPTVEPESEIKSESELEPEQPLQPESDAVSPPVSVVPVEQQQAEEALVAEAIEAVEPTQLSEPMVAETLETVEVPEQEIANSDYAVEESFEQNEAPTEELAMDVPQGTIDMLFTGDCWVEVRDGGGNLIYSNLKRHGESLTVQGVPPLEAKLGNGNVVELSYNSQPVTFRVPHHNVVRVRLGE